MDFFDLFAETKEIVKPGPKPSFMAEHRIPVSGNEMPPMAVPNVSVPSVPVQEVRAETNNCAPLKPPMSLAMAAVPEQGWCRLYEPQIALDRGTIFPDLDFPFLGKEGVGR
ncbi:MAG: spore coat associated protein CotJA [Oscillospiraceae bacterium]